MIQSQPFLTKGKMLMPVLCYLFMKAFSRVFMKALFYFYFFFKEVVVSFFH